MYYEKEKEMKKRITKNHIAIWSILRIFIILFSTPTIYYIHKHTFSSYKWINNPENRNEMLNSLEDKYKLIGMSKIELTGLLGNPDDIDTMPNDEYDSQLIYYVGYNKYKSSNIYFSILLKKDIVFDYHTWSDRD